MWAIPVTTIVSIWALANIVFAFVEPPAAVARFAPRKVVFIFSLLPEPWDRRLGLLFNGLLGLGIAGFFLYMGFAT